MDKPFSQACENNKGPILEILKRVFEKTRNVLEIGSGTGQHAAYFARHLKHLEWQPSDLTENLPGIQQWIDEIPSANLKQPLALDVTCQPWPVGQVDGVFSANTAHILPWDSVPHLIEGISRVLLSGGKCCLYGPFNYVGQFTSQSNANFDQWLKSQAPSQGIREFHDINRLAMENGMVLLEDNAMPANNRLLVWQKI